MNIKFQVGIIICIYHYVKILSSFVDKKLALLSIFSVTENSKQIFDTTPPPRGQIPCLNGLRVITMGWVLSGHTYSQSLYLGLPVINNYYVATEVSYLTISKISLCNDLLPYILYSSWSPLPSNLY